MFRVIGLQKPLIRLLCEYRRDRHRIFKTYPCPHNSCLRVDGVRFYVPTAAELVELEQERKIVKETTDGHSYEMRDDEYSYSKGPTGDMEVDEIIMLYMKKPTVVGIGTKVVNPII